MRRYTAKLFIKGQRSDTERIKTTIEAAFLSCRVLADLGPITWESDNVALVQMRSEADRDKVALILEQLEFTLDWHLEKIGWGWLVANSGLADIVDRGSSTALDFGDAQVPDTHELRYGVGMSLVAALSLLGILSSLLLLAWSVYRPSYISACFGFFMGQVSAIWHFIGYELFDMTRKALKSGTGSGHPNGSLGRRYQDFRFMRALGEHWCCIEGHGGTSCFPINAFYGLDYKTLVTTILKQAQLLYVEGRAWENAIYKQFDAP